MDSLEAQCTGSCHTPSVPRFIVYGVEGTLTREVADIIGNHYGVPVHSVEQCVERQTQRSISEIVIEQGDDVLRKSEHNALNEVMKTSGVALLSGGSLDTEYARQRVKQAQCEGATLVWCQAQLQAITHRLGFNQPRSIALGPVRAQLATMIRQREDLWKHTLIPDFCVDTTHGVDRVAQTLQVNG
ncbi:MAG: shikimate kinase [Actinomycetaceae bacterium]|nr:shikimate kinase [Actinomycetaceae bacterium]